jgi:hypothetical protein
MMPECASSNSVLLDAERRNDFRCCGEQDIAETRAENCQERVQICLFLHPLWLVEMSVKSLFRMAGTTRLELATSAVTVAG